MSSDITKFAHSRKMILLAVSIAMLSGCANLPVFTEAGLPATVIAPAGNHVVMETVANGTIGYECRTKSDGSGFDWAFSGAEALLIDLSGKPVGRYYGPPDTWESSDSSKVTGAQIALVSGAPGNIPIQLMKANPATGAGKMTGITFILRVAATGGAPNSICSATTTVKKKMVTFRAGYVLYKAN